MFKYASAHNGIDTLADYLMDIGPDTRTVTNPARVAARQTVAEAQAALVTAERALPQLLAGPGTPASSCGSARSAVTRAAWASATVWRAATRAGLVTVRVSGPMSIR